jgi:hypothetical protein
VYKEKMLRTTVRAAAEMPAWEVADAALGGIWRFNAALRYARDTRLYPYALEVFIPVAQAGRRGQHETAEANEEKVIALVADRAVLAGALTAPDGQRFTFYTDSPDWTAKLQGQLRAATGIGTLRVYCDPDAHWSIYRSRRGGGRGSGRADITVKYLALIALGPMSLLPWIMVKTAYGQAWGGGELAVLVILVAAFALPRAYTRRFTERPALILGARAVAVSAVLFALLALTRVPAWIGVITSLLAGTALVAGVRVARSSTGRAIARRARGGAVRSSGPRGPRGRTIIRLSSRPVSARRNC